MKLHDDFRSDPPSERDTAWELIPWYVNGTLSDEDTRLVETYSLGSDEFAAEIARQSALAERVAKTDPFDVPLRRSWETLRAQVAADTRARTPAQGGHVGWLGALRGRKTLAFGGAMTACLALALAVQFSDTPGTEDFVTLTRDADKSTASPIIRFQTSGGLDAVALTERLADLGVTAVTGPSASGVFMAALEPQADASALAEAMMALDIVLFAAPGANQ